MKIKNLRWYIIVLVMLGTITNYLSRNTLGIAAPTMLKEIGFTEQQYSWITAAFNLGLSHRRRLRRLHHGPVRGARGLLPHGRSLVGV
ncbi:hypothetical protein LNO81_31255 [Klebsiella variicola subsp. variicola]|nr:hypothetical protein [Klebsiella variicola subsp. variicola]